MLCTLLAYSPPALCGRNHRIPLSPLYTDRTGRLPRRRNCAPPARAPFCHHALSPPFYLLCPAHSLPAVALPLWPLAPQRYFVDSLI